jgi:hypothetical protein
MAKKKETRKLTIEFEPDVREIIEEIQQQRDLLSFKDAVQTIIRDWKRKAQKSIAQSMDEEQTLNKSSLPASDAESEPEKPLNLGSMGNLEAYTHYKEDINRDLQTVEPKQEQHEAPSVFEYLEKNPCPYRAIVKEPDGIFSVYCEVRKIPAEVCQKQQERYQHFDRQCRPLSKKSKQPPRPRPARIGSTRIDMGNHEDGGDMFDLGDQ